VIERCPVPRFRRQALGNSGEILLILAESATSPQDQEALRHQGYERSAAAVAVEETFVSLYNLWQAASQLGKSEECADLLGRMKRYPEFEQLPPEHRPPEENG
jgi:hypothetical protein